MNKINKMKLSVNFLLQIITQFNCKFFIKKNEILLIFVSYLNFVLFSFTKRERVKEMIRLLTEEPEANCSHERGHKFPFLAS